MISQNRKYSIKYTFEKLQEAYNHLKIAGSEDYFLTLGNINEIHLMKKDATKSVFLGKIFVDEDTTQEIEARKIWNVLQSYFTGTPIVQETKVETKVTKKATRKPKKVEVVEEEPEVMEADEDSDWVDAVL